MSCSVMTRCRAIFIVACAIVPSWAIALEPPRSSLQRIGEEIFEVFYVPVVLLGIGAATYGIFTLGRAYCEHTMRRNYRNECALLSHHAYFVYESENSLTPLNDDLIKLVLLKQAANGAACTYPLVFYEKELSSSITQLSFVTLLTFQHHQRDCLQSFLNELKQIRTILRSDYRFVNELQKYEERQSTLQWQRELNNTLGALKDHHGGGASH